MKQILYLLLSMSQVPNRQVQRCYSPPKQQHRTLIQYTICHDTRYITRFSRHVLQYIPVNTHSTCICIYTLTGYWQFYWTGSLWIIYCGRCLYTQCTEQYNSCQLVLEEAHYCTVMLLKQCGLVLVTSSSRILTFQDLKFLILTMKVTATST